MLKMFWNNHRSHYPVSHIKEAQFCRICAFYFAPEIQSKEHTTKGNFYWKRTQQEWHHFNPIHCIGVLFLQSIAMQQLLKLRLGRPTGGNPITASTALVVEDALSAWETLRRAQPVLQGGPQLVIRDLAPNVTDRREGKKIGDVSQGVVREQLLRLRGRETSNCRVVELSRTHSAHSGTQCTHSAHRLEPRLHTEPVLQNRRQHSRGFYPLLLTTTSPYRATPFKVSFF